MTKKISATSAKIKIILLIFALLAIILAAFFQRMASEQDTMSILQQANSQVTHYNELSGHYDSYELFDEAGNFLNYAVISNASGYGGPLWTLTTVDNDGLIDRVVILDQVETPVYLKKVFENGYPENLQQKQISESLKKDTDVRVVSGATLTTDAILLSVAKGVAQIGGEQLNIATPDIVVFTFGWEEVFVVFILLAALIATIFKVRKLRVWIMLASVVVIGFVTKSTLTLGNFVSIITGDVPVIIERPIWYVLVIGILILTILLGRNIYCGLICPFGAVQEGIFKGLNLKTYRMDPRIFVFAKKVIWFIIWLAVLLSLLFNNPGISSYEPFSNFFGGSGVTFQWITMGLVLLLSILVYRFWCRALCPVGVILDAVAKWKRTTLKWMKKRGQLAEANEAVHSSVSQCSNCQAACDANKNKQKKVFTPFEKAIISLIVVLNLSIIATLIQNVNL